MFARIASVYDLMNTVMSAGLHRRWRQRAAAFTGLSKGGRALDVATGTGDFAFELAKLVGPTGTVVGCDFAAPMLERAWAKAAKGGFGNVRFELADGLALPYPDGSFDAATVGFGVRNYADLGAGLRELVRVVRSGGKVVILELTPPQQGLLARFYNLWFDRLVPLIGSLSPLPEAYTYLPRSVRSFLPPQELAAALAQSGLVEVEGVVMAGGIVTVCAGRVP